MVNIFSFFEGMPNELKVLGERIYEKAKEVGRNFNFEVEDNYSEESRTFDETSTVGNLNFGQKKVKI